KSFLPNILIWSATTSCRRSVTSLRNKSNPALQLAFGEVADDRHPGLAVVEAGERGEVFPAVVAKDFRVLVRDLVEGLEAIGGEARHHHREILDTAAGEALHRLVGIGLEPLGRAEARLEREHEARLVEAEALTQEPRGLRALAMIGIALREIFLRHAMERG